MRQSPFTEMNIHSTGDLIKSYAESASTTSHSKDDIDRLKLMGEYLKKVSSGPILSIFIPKFKNEFSRLKMNEVLKLKPHSIICVSSLMISKKMSYHDAYSHYMSLQKSEEDEAKK